MTVVSRSQGVPVLPAHLVDPRGMSAAEFREFIAERNEWFRAHSINPGDWSAVYPVLKASWAAHGLTHRLRHLEDGT